MKKNNVLPTLSELDQKIQESENRVRRLEDEASKERARYNKLIRQRIEESYNSIKNNHGSKKTI